MINYIASLLCFLTTKLNVAQEGLGESSNNKIMHCDMLDAVKHIVYWDDFISFFQSRIRTGVTSNIKPKDPKTFLIDCKILFKRRTQNALKKHIDVKVNTAFCFELEIIKGDKIQNEHTNFTKPNAPIYQSINPDKCFKENVAESILSELEEFKESSSGWALKSIMISGVNINKSTLNLDQLTSSFLSKSNNSKPVLMSRMQITPT